MGWGEPLRIEKVGSPLCWKCPAPGCPHGLQQTQAVKIVYDGVPDEYKDNLPNPAKCPQHNVPLIPCAHDEFRARTTPQ